MEIPLLKRLDFLGGRPFAMTLLKAGIGYLLYLTLLWALHVMPPAQYMVWGPFLVWGVFFLINITISVLTHRYAFKGNLLFHIAFIVVAAGVLISAFWRFEGKVVMMEGDAFFGEKKYYITRPPSGEPPRLSFKITDINAEFWEDKLHFTDLYATVKYPAETLERTGLIWLNGGLKINGARLRIAGFGLYPELVIEEKGRVVLKGSMDADVFPPPTEASFDVKNYKIRLRAYTDPVEKNGKIENASMRLKEPLFLVRVAWLDRVIFNGLVKKGEQIRFGDLSIIFTGLKPYVTVGIVNDPGEAVVFMGFIVGILGLILRLLRG